MYWEKTCGGNGQSINMIVEGNEFCNGREVELSVYQRYEAGYFEEVLDLGETETFIEKIGKVNFSDADVAFGTWNISVDASDNYFFKANMLNVKYSSELSLLNISDCTGDQDCDGVEDVDDGGNIKDQCPDSLCNDLVDANGCSAGQASCIAQWDCSMIEWSECDETNNLMTRNIDQCIKPTDPACLGPGMVPPSSKVCLKQSPFPIYDSIGLIISLLIISGFYFRRRYDINPSQL